MLRNYQIDLSEKAYEIIKKLRIVYLAMEMRVGKTLIALKTAELLKAKNVLFVTKKKAIRSVELDYQRENFKFNLIIINYEQLKKYVPVYDVIIADESHLLGAFPKPSLRTKYLKSIVNFNYLILLSGTPSPESYSQLYHQFWISELSPFQEINFYKWARKYVDIKLKIINGVRINDYSRARQYMIDAVLKPYILTYTQERAGFKQARIQEDIIYIEQSPELLLLMRYLIQNRYYKFKSDGSEIICDTAVKLQSKLHQLSSGTVKTEEGQYKILETSKAQFIKENYQNQKIAVFYKFIAEGKVLKAILNNWTESPEEFNQSTNKIFISQLQSGSMGTNLSTADILIFYNIDFSAVQYWQARARLQDMKRQKQAVVHWLFNPNGLENKVLKAVQKKKDYTVRYFKKDFLDGAGKEHTNKNHKVFEEYRSLCS